MRFQSLVALALVGLSAALPVTKTSSPTVLDRGCYCPEGTNPDSFTRKCTSAKGKTVDQICPVSRRQQPLEAKGKKCHCPDDTMPDIVSGKCVVVQTDNVIDKVCV
ncbi:hypothetical protein V2G26_001428 [Clonostachys chloroleuca]|uniref:Uncharacterized protein n=1 Tax=Clonostachys chloroleuca TaxID=1926264 RepID=A0AA35LR14_9HYPO|nr:unnamed protein product [Clonostachys chloroleuca]